MPRNIYNQKRPAPDERYCAFIDADRTLCLGEVREVYPSSNRRVWRNFRSESGRWVRHDGHNVFSVNFHAILFLTRGQYETISPLDITFE